MLVALQNACGGGYSSPVDEESGSLTVCAEILFINGTSLTTDNYTVIISTDDPTANFTSALSKFRGTNSVYWCIIQHSYSFFILVREQGKPLIGFLPEC